jgi:enoyl-[acyl-carrier protein] reductase I
MSSGTPSKKIALIMGVANQRSIAWSCLETFLQKGWNVIYTVQNLKTQSKVQKLVEKTMATSDPSKRGIVLGGFTCDVTESLSMESFFQGSLPELLHQQQEQPKQPALHAVIHSLAFAPNLKTPLLNTNRESFLQAHEISSYSLIQVARESLPYLQSHQLEENSGDEFSNFTTSLTTISFLGAVRAIPGYNIMGPAKASLESVVRGLALDLGRHPSNHNSNFCPVRVNAVRAGPVPTLSSKGGIADFELMRNDVQRRAPLGNVSAPQVSATVYHVAAEAWGMTGQTIDIDGGYSIVAGP